MKKLVLMLTLGAFLMVPAAANAVSVFADVETFPNPQTDPYVCSTTVPGMYYVYVMLASEAGEPPDAVTGVELGWTVSSPALTIFSFTFHTIWTPAGDWSVGDIFAGCLCTDLPVLVGNFFVNYVGGAEFLAFGINPISGLMQVADCDFVEICLLYGHGAGFGTECPEFESPTATDETSWGGVKAMFR